MLQVRIRKELSKALRRTYVGQKQRDDQDQGKLGETKYCTINPGEGQKYGDTTKYLKVPYARRVKVSSLWNILH